MPHKRLPAQLIARLRKANKRLLKDERVERWENIDHRKDYPPLSDELKQVGKISVDWWGGRVRLLKLRKENSPVKVVIKKDHPPGDSIRRINKLVAEHNLRYHPNNYVLLPVRAYPLNENYIAMGYTNRPSIEEIISSECSTKRGFLFLTRLAKRHQMKEEDLRQRLRDAAFNVSYRTGISIINLLLLGIRNGKFVFVPLVDSE
ncbi:MAG: hypothetical protein V1776_04640 [Candidatus Diapherotrites archaeon]